MVILDTDLITLMERVNSTEGARLRDRLLELAPAQVVTTVITYEEQMRGWLAFLSKANGMVAEVNAYRRLSRHAEYYSGIKVLPFDDLAAVQFQQLRSSRLRVGTMDLRIAAIALSQRATLLSRNLRDFSRIPGLDVQDWSV